MLKHIFRQFGRLSLPNRTRPLSTLPSESIIGRSVRVDRAFSVADLEQYGQLSGDTNPVHFDANFAHQLNFAQPIVHGSLINGVVSRVIGTMLPGPGSILLYQDLHFSNPLFVDEQFTTTVTVDNLRHNIYTCRYECTTEAGKKVLVGKAKVLYKGDNNHIVDVLDEE